MSHLPDVDVDQLISLVKCRPVLWDKTEEKYKDKFKTQEAWKIIFVQIIDNFEELGDKQKKEFGKHVIKKWTQIRDSYRKSLSKTKAAMKSGSGAAKTKAYIYTSQLRFLDKIFDHRNTEDTLPENDDEVVIIKSEKNIPGPSALNDVTFVKKNETYSKQRKIRKRKIDPVELEMIPPLQETPNRHLSFFKGLLPSLEDFDECDTLDFQMEVLKVVKSIRQRRHPSAVDSLLRTKLRTFSISDDT